MKTIIIVLVIAIPLGLQAQSYVTKGDTKSLYKNAQMTKRGFIGEFAGVMESVSTYANDLVKVKVELPSITTGKMKVVYAYTRKNDVMQPIRLSGSALSEKAHHNILTYKVGPRIKEAFQSDDQFYKPVIHIDISTSMLVERAAVLSYFDEFFSYAPFDEVDVKLYTKLEPMKKPSYTIIVDGDPGSCGLTLIKHVGQQEEVLLSLTNIDINSSSF